jgi:hypothetical protein
VLQSWLETVDPEDVDGFMLRVFYGELIPKPVLVEHAEAHRDRLHARLAVFDEIDETNTNRGHDWYHRLVLDLGYARVRAELHWAEDVLSKLRRKR